jgi:Domain of unknown function (DUF4399)
MDTHSADARRQGAPGITPRNPDRGAGGTGGAPAARPSSLKLRAFALALLLAGGAASGVVGRVGAADGPGAHDATPEASGGSPSPPPPGARDYFIDLKDGDRVPIKVLVRMGLFHMGVAPAGYAPPASAHRQFPVTGHHHIIVDAPLPPPGRPIPADDNHIHLGGGQTEAEITLSPGPHTLQLEMGDANHIPTDPPVTSALIHVTAAEPRTPAPADASTSFIGLRQAQGVSSPIRLYFGLQGMGVAPANSDVPDTGYFNLVIDAPEPDPDQPMPKDDHHIAFTKGDTQTEQRLEPGHHTLQLVFTDTRGRNFDPPVRSKRMLIKVRAP